MKNTKKAQQNQLEDKIIIIPSLKIKSWVKKHSAKAFNVVIPDALLKTCKLMEINLEFFKGG